LLKPPKIIRENPIIKKKSFFCQLLKNKRQSNNITAPIKKQSKCEFRGIKYSFGFLNNKTESETNHLVNLSKIISPVKTIKTIKIFVFISTFILPQKPEKNLSGERAPAVGLEPTT
jgi:hypothetical protein